MLKFGNVYVYNFSVNDLKAFELVLKFKHYYDLVKGNGFKKVRFREEEGKGGSRILTETEITVQKEKEELKVVIQKETTEYECEIPVAKYGDTQEFCLLKEVDRVYVVRSKRETFEDVPKTEIVITTAEESKSPEEVLKALAEKAQGKYGEALREFFEGKLFEIANMSEALLEISGKVEIDSFVREDIERAVENLKRLLERLEACSC